MSADLSRVTIFKLGAPARELRRLGRTFPRAHFAQLMSKGFPFYRTTFWYPLERDPENVFESLVCSLKPLANPSAAVRGVEWWFSVLLTNATPQWLLPYHFDRNDLLESDSRKLKYPELSSVLFLNAVPYGELVVTDQVLTEQGVRPKQPNDMRFIRPKRNLYAVFPGHLYHGVLGRMWRPIKSAQLRVSMAINWWQERPNAAYVRDSRECMSAFRLGSFA
jgi:hypothetical protein